jgi:DNA-binding transcriptional LysR family regulator
MDEFTRILTFIKVVEAGSFSAAARNQSSISSVARQVKSLEDELGVRLLNRSTRSLSLTEPGRILYERARGISSDLNSAISEASSFQDNVKGALKVSLRVSAGTTIIVPALPALLKQYPELTFDITLTDERPDLVATNIDVAVWMGDLPNSEIVARRLTPSQRIVCGAPQYFERHGVPQTPADLQRHNCLLFTPRSYSNTWEFARSGQHERVDVHGSIRTDNGLVLLSAAMSGIGVVVVNEWMVRLPIAEGRMMRVLQDYSVNPTTGEADLYAVYSSSRGMSRKVRVFVDFLVQLFRGEGASADAEPVTTQGR